MGRRKKNLNGPLITWTREQQIIIDLLGIALTPRDRGGAPKIGTSVSHNLSTGEVAILPGSKKPELVYKKLPATYENLATHCGWGSQGQQYFDRARKAGVPTPERVVKMYTRAEINDFEKKVIYPIRRNLRERFYLYAIPVMGYEKDPTTGRMLLKKTSKKILSLIPVSLRDAKEYVADMDTKKADAIIQECKRGAVWITHSLYRGMKIAANEEESLRLLGDYGEIATREEIYDIAASGPDN